MSKLKYFTRIKNIYAVACRHGCKQRYYAGDPFLTQALVDKGINLRNLNFIYLIWLGSSHCLPEEALLTLSEANCCCTWNADKYFDGIGFSPLKLPISFERHITGDLITYERPSPA
jgi:hypothetical protein